MSDKDNAARKKKNVKKYLKFERQTRYYMCGMKIQHALPENNIRSTDVDMIPLMNGPFGF